MVLNSYTTRLSQIYNASKENDLKMAFKKLQLPKPVRTPYYTFVFLMFWQSCGDFLGAGSCCVYL